MQECMELAADDREKAHGDADDVLCGRLLKLGEDELVEKYNSFKKWYA